MPPLLMVTAAYSVLQSHVDAVATLATTVALIDGLIELGKAVASGFAWISPRKHKLKAAKTA